MASCSHSLRLSRILCVLIIFLQAAEIYGQRYCYRTRASSQRRSRTTSTSCGWWGRRCRETIYYYVTVYSQSRFCCSGWGGPYCSRPACQPACQNNAICQPDNNCYCRPGSTGNRCAAPVTCSSTKDCYPGTCHGNNECRCTSAFSGNLCNNIRDGGAFLRCAATITAASSSDTAYETDCVTPNTNTYTNQRNLAALNLDWEVTWELPSDVPNAPDYIVESKPGIIQTYAEVTLKNSAGGTERSSNRQECTGHDVSASKPYLLVQCRDIRHTVENQPATHLNVLQITFYSRTGGFKRFKNPVDHRVYNRAFTGQLHSESVEIIFDLEDPIHCSRKSSSRCDYESQPAFGVYPDTTRLTEVRVETFGWEDADSGLKEHRFQLYQMEYNPASGKLVMSDSPLSTKTWRFEGDLPTFNVLHTGVYSILMNVYDNAGNWARARTIIFVDTQNTIEINRENQITVTQGFSSDIGLWVDKDGDIEIQWQGIFSNKQHVKNHFLASVDRIRGIMDDTFESDGNRTVNEIANQRDGITHFEVGWKKPQSSYTMYGLDGDQQAHSFSDIDRTDGDTIQFIVEAYDLAGHTQNVSVEVRVDSTPPEILSQANLEENVESERDNMFYTSRISLRMVDRQSGMGQIKFSVFDVAAPDAPLHQETQKSSLMESSRKTECLNTGDCYCTSYDDCYEYEQSIWINNCWFSDRASGSMQMKIEYHAYNNANRESSGEMYQTVTDVGKLNGIGYYPAPQNIGTTRDLGDSIDVIWFLPPSCYPFESISITYEQGEKTHVVTVPGDATRHTLNSLEADSQFQLKMEVIFVDGTRVESETYTFSTKPIEIERQLGAGGIVGIVIAAIIFLLLLAALIVMFIRYRKQKHPVPLVIREKTTAIRDGISRRFSRHPEGHLHRMETRTYDNNYTDPHSRAKSVALNVAYAEADDDMYIYGNMETDLNAAWKVGGDSLKIKGNVPGAKGKFADVKYGLLRVPEGEKKVVVKMNKAGASEDDKLLMKAKMNYLATQVPKDEFIVNMLGAIPPPKGPMIILENCDLGSLLDWLKNIVKVTGDVEEQMVAFTIHSAKGMQHLHDSGILHRRLGARNVLLQTDPVTQQIRAKLAGFGPLKGEQDGSENKHKQDRIPIRWMAPEQFNKPEGEKRHYSKETDTWSYGILVWEIFSKGTTPYSDYSNIPNLKAAVINGYRMEKPSDCPDFMFSEIVTPSWEESPHMRPSFDIMVAKLERQFGSQSGEFYDYDQGGAPSVYSNASRSLAMQVD